MPFILEALNARHGDALLLHYGSDDAPRLAVIDGGPSGVYDAALRPRLDAIRQDRQQRGLLAPEAPLPLPLLMVSHIDDDHINGILDLTAELVEIQEENRPLPIHIHTLWHNSFDDLLGHSADALSAALPAVTHAAATGAPLPLNTSISRHGAALIASVRQGRQLRRDADALNLDLRVNFPFDGLVTRPDSGAREVDLGGGLVFTVLGPSQAHVDDLQAAWDRKLQDMGVGRTAEAMVADFVDRSVFNLASIVVLAKQDGRSVLLTGDARGDHILDGLQSAGLLRDGHLHVDVLKVPHHGSDRNVSTDFFRTVTAEHYVFSGDGKHSNPELATLDMVLEARGDAPFTLHFTNHEDRLERHLDQVRHSDHAFAARYREAPRPSLSIDLLP